MDGIFKNRLIYKLGFPAFTTGLGFMGTSTAVHDCWCDIARRPGRATFHGVFCIILGRKCCNYCKCQTLRRLHFVLSIGKQYYMGYIYNILYYLGYIYYLYNRITQFGYTVAIVSLFIFHFRANY